MKKRTTNLIFIVCILLFSGLAVSCERIVPDPAPVDENGIVDLSSWNSERDNPIYLQKGLNFYWEKLLIEPKSVSPIGLRIESNCVFDLENPSTTSTCDGYQLTPETQGIFDGSISGSFVETPHIWGSVEGRELGYGLYRIRIKSNGEKIAFYNNNWVGNSSFRFWIKEGNRLVLLYSIGNPTRHKETSVEIAMGLYAVHDFQPGISEIYIEVANYNYKYGYLTNQIWLSSPNRAIGSLRQYFTAEAVIFGLILMSAVIHIFQYGFRKKLKSALWFGIFCFILAIRVALVARFPQILFPDNNWYNTLNRLEYLSITISPIAMVVYLRYILQRQINLIGFRAIILYATVSSVFVIFNSAVFYSRFIILLQAGVFLTIGFSFAELVIKSFSSKKNLRKIARMLIGVLTVYGFCMIHDMLLYAFHWKTFELSGYGLFFFVLGQSLVISRMNAEAWENSDRLTADLEKEVALRTQQYKDAYAKSEMLLLNILPWKVADELKTQGKIEPESFESVSVCFTDFVGFTQIAESLTPAQLVSELDFCFSEFDKIIEKHRLEKLKTIGDSYMFAGGIPIETATHAIDCTLAALEICRFMENLKEKNQTEGKEYWSLRLGINSGSLIAGVIGNRKFAYDIWSDTVNTASRCESSGEVGKINIGEPTYHLIKDFFDCEYRGKIPAKNKADLSMYFVKDIKQDLQTNGEPNEKFMELYESFSI